jgi:glucose-6-phosphate isomerase
VKTSYSKKVSILLTKYAAKVQELKKEFLLELNDKGFPFSNYIGGNIGNYKKIISKLPIFDTIVVIGIGGSALGTKMIYNCFKKIFKKRIIIVDTTEPERLAEVIENIDIKKTIFIPISKSGSTMETAANTLFFIGKAKETLKDNWKDHFVFITDQKKGDLRRFVEENRLFNLSLPEELGGRYSVLSNVGLFPLYLGGFPIDELISGAKEYLNDVKQGTLTEPFEIGFANYKLYKRRHNILILFPYVYRLKTYGEWFIQLWSESLGKINKEGRKIGQTPMIAVGPTDQHSIIQLFTDGPQDKVIFFLNVRDRNVNFTISEKLNYSSFGYLYNKDFGNIVNIEFEGTQENLNNLGVPTLELELKELSPENLGRLIMFSYILTVYSSHLLDIDPFDQPGVEGGKRIMYRRLGKRGY